MTKDTKVSIRIKDKEMEYLTKLARTKGLSLSEYIRVKLLEKSENGWIPGHKKEILTLGLIAYYTLGKIAKKQLTEEEIREAMDRANTVLEKWNMNEK